MRIESPRSSYPSENFQSLSEPHFVFGDTQVVAYEKMKFTAVDSALAVNNRSRIFAGDAEVVFRPPKPFTDMCSIRVSEMDEEAASGISVLLGYLKEEEPCLRWFAAAELGAMGAEPKDIQDPLIDIAENEDELLFVRLAAVTTLGEVRAASAVPVLIKIMMNDSENLHLVMGAMDALGNIGDAAQGAVPEVMYIKEFYDRPEVTLSVISTLYEIGSEEAEKAIQAISQDPREEDFVREFATGLAE